MFYSLAMDLTSLKMQYPSEALARVAAELSAHYQGTFSQETVERYVLESHAALQRTAKIQRYLVQLTEKFVKDRLLALAQAQNSELKTRPEVLFVCVQNSGRSQIAMAFMQEISQGKIGVRSAGSMPADQLSDKTMVAMQELGIDMSAEFPKPLTDDVVQAADIVITMGCGDACPIYPGKKYLDWNLPDPALLDMDGVRAVTSNYLKQPRFEKTSGLSFFYDSYR
jgi:protein-tyrosine-phosphatase